MTENNIIKWAKGEGANATTLELVAIIDKRDARIRELEEEIDELKRKNELLIQTIEALKGGR